MSNLLQVRRGTASAWTSANPILSQGEIAYETDTSLIKFGDGASNWTDLPYAEAGGIHSVLTLTEAATPSPPSAGDLQIYTQSRGGRMLAFMQGPSGVDTPLQPALFANGVYFVAPGSSTAFTVLGGPTFTAVGTVAHPALSATVDLKTWVNRATITSAATANSAAELRAAQLMCARGDQPGFGGFFNRWRFGFNTAVANQRSAVGLWGSTGATATTQNPSSLTNCIFIGNDSADANLQIMHNDGAGTCTKVDLGSNFAIANTANIYDFDLFCPPNGSTVGWRVANLRTGNAATGLISTDLVASTTFLAPHAYANNGGTAAAVVLEFYREYLEKDL